MQEVIFTIGIPGCGKSKWALDFQKENRDYIIIERDEIRAELFANGDINTYKYSRSKEQKVSLEQRFRIINALNMGCSVILADTNLNEHHRKTMREGIRAAYPDIVFKNKTFDVSLKTCIKRNQKRHATVPESVLIRMEQQMREFLGKVRCAHALGRPHCIIVDIDGTVADMKGVRGPFDWSQVGNDNPIDVTINLVRGYLKDSDVQLIFLSGRDSVCSHDTERWLSRYFTNFQLYMRPEGSTESDDIVKERLYTNHVHGKYNVDFVMDDREQVCRLWASIGLKLIDVGGRVSDF